MHFEEWMELAVKAFEVAGVVILAVGSVIALMHASRWRSNWMESSRGANAAQRQPGGLTAEGHARGAAVHWLGS